MVDRPVSNNYGIVDTVNSRHSNDFFFTDVTTFLRVVIFLVFASINELYIMIRVFVILYRVILPY